LATRDPVTMLGSSTARRYREALRVVVAGESKAYGFTLVIWGTGTITLAQHGSPRAIDVMAFVGGALAAIAAVIATSYGGLDVELEPKSARQRAAGAIHVSSVALAIACAWVLTTPVGIRWLAYGIAGTSACLIYQLVVGLEVLLSAE
jgi:hypothetical protein